MWSEISQRQKDKCRILLIGGIERDKEREGVMASENKSWTLAIELLMLRGRDRVREWGEQKGRRTMMEGWGGRGATNTNIWNHQHKRSCHLHYPSDKIRKSRIGRQYNDWTGYQFLALLGPQHHLGWSAWDTLAGDPCRAQIPPLHLGSLPCST